MKSLTIPNLGSHKIATPHFTVGTGSNWDVSLPGDEDERLLFAIQSRGESSFLVPGNEKVAVNGKRAVGQVELHAADRITWNDGVAIFFDEVFGATGNPNDQFAKTCLETLQEISEKLMDRTTPYLSLDTILKRIAELSGAEEGYLLAENSRRSGWEAVAAFGKVRNQEQTQSLVSNTILDQAIRDRTPVFIESVIGHPLERQASILSSRVFSIACLPLFLGDRAIGAAYLYTHTPGKTIRRERLGLLTLLVTQATLLVSALRNGKSDLPKTTSKRLIFDPSNPSNPMHEIEGRISKFASSDISVLLLGETGTGKEVVANEIHERSSRKGKPFVAVNCGAIPPALMESMLFGHVKGAFTGADKSTEGKLAQANGGTLFLDEIGDLPLDLQVKLLRALQEKRIEPVGSHQSIPLDFRLVSATHQKITQLIETKSFRSDLYYRINGAVIALPPLRERGSDILILAEHFLTAAKTNLTLSEDARKKLLGHTWPGNVRELQQTIQRAIVLCEGTEITARDLELETLNHSSTGMPTASSGLTLDEAQEQFTRELLERTLVTCGGNRTATAKRLGISERTLYRLLASAGLGSST